MPSTLKEPLISVGEFLDPWVQRASLLAEALGATKECRSLLQPGGLLAKYAENVLAAVKKDSVEKEEKEALLRQADWMVDTLSGMNCLTNEATGLGAAHLSESFWGLPSGRVLIALYGKLLGGDLAMPIQAARLLGVDAQTVYRMMYTSRLPSYPDFLSAAARRPHRIRMDHLKRLLAEDNGNGN